MSLSDTSLVSVFVLYLFLEGRMMRCTWIPPIKMQKHAVVITSHYLIVSFTCTRKEKKKMRTITVICQQLYSVLTRSLLTDVLL